MWTRRWFTRGLKKVILQKTVKVFVCALYECLGRLRLGTLHDHANAQKVHSASREGEFTEDGNGGVNAHSNDGLLVGAVLARILMILIGVRHV